MGVSDDYFPSELEKAEKEAKETREKELAILNKNLSRLLLLTEVSLGLIAPFVKIDEIGGQSFSEIVTAADRPGISWEFILNLTRDKFADISSPVLRTFTIKGWSSSLTVGFYSSAKEIRFNLSKENLNSSQSYARILFQELYFETNGGFYVPMMQAISKIHKMVQRFLGARAFDVNMREDNSAWGRELFQVNAEDIVNLQVNSSIAWANFQRDQRALQASRQLIFETCQALRETRGFVKSKKLAEIRENLERKSREIAASINV